MFIGLESENEQEEDIMPVLERNVCELIELEQQELLERFAPVLEDGEDDFAGCDVLEMSDAIREYQSWYVTSYFLLCTHFCSFVT